MDRYVYDIGTSVYLLFPDRALLRVDASSTSDNKIYLTVSLELASWGNEANAPTPNRPILLLNETLDVLRPKDPRIYRFRFVKKSGLTGALTLVCDAEEWPSIKQDIEQQPGYLNIVYKGTSEEFLSEKILATVQLAEPDLLALANSRNLFDQLSRLKQWLSERTLMSGDDLYEWLQQIVDEAMPVAKISGHYMMEVPKDPVGLSFVKKMEVVISVNGAAPDVRPRWLE